MKLRIPALAILCTAALTHSATAGRPLTDADDFFERIDSALTFSLADGKVKARVSGLLDLEAYSLPQPAPGLVFTERYSLFNPRLTTFLDLQFGSKVYAFLQARADQGFDPGYEPSRLALDEYAIRFTPWEDGRLSIQVGKFATVLGTWATRHSSWDSPFITAPLPYENLTGMWDSSPADSLDTLRFWGGVSAAKSTSRPDALGLRRLRLPLVWGPSYTSGIAVFGHLGKFEYAAEVKNASLSSRPEMWDGTAVQWRRPTFSGRIGWRPNQNWNLGASGSVGCYLGKEASADLPPGTSLSDYRQITLAQDISFEWHRWQIWAEVFENRFEVPGVGNADSLAYYIEAKYKITPQLYGAVRWNQHLFGTLPDGAGGEDKWGGDIWRTDMSLGYRFNAWTQLKLQYGIERRAADIAGFAHTLAAQFTIRF